MTAAKDRFSTKSAVGIAAAASLALLPGFFIGSLAFDSLVGAAFRAGGSNHTGYHQRVILDGLIRRTTSAEHLMYFALCVGLTVLGCRFVSEKLAVRWLVAFAVGVVTVGCLPILLHPSDSPLPIVLSRLVSPGVASAIYAFAFTSLSGPILRWQGDK